LLERWIGPSSPAARLVLLELAVVTLTQKLALPVGASQVQLALLIHLVFVALLVLRRACHISVLQCSLYLASALLALLNHVAAVHSEFSVPSLLLYLCMYVSFCFVVPISRADYHAALRGFQLLALAVGCLVAMDWIIQLAGGAMPNLEVVIPAKLRLEGYAYIQPLVWGAALMKPNALIFPEASGVGQFLATALVIEVCFFQRTKYLVFYASGTLASFSGSAMLLLLAASPLMVRSINTKLIPGLVAAALVGGLVAWQLGVFENVEHRSTELSREESSGYYRFVAPVHLIEHALSRDFVEAMLGSGAGSAPKGANVIWNPFSKALYDYGLVFALVFLAFTISFSVGSGRPLVLGWISIFNYHFLGGGFLIPWSMILTWCVVGAYVVARAEDPASEATLRDAQATG
jgi:hypothetical protein